MYYIRTTYVLHTYYIIYTYYNIIYTYTSIIYMCIGYIALMDTLVFLWSTCSPSLGPTLSMDEKRQYRCLYGTDVD